MQAAVTGHTSIIGSLITNYLKNKNYTVLGFSKTTGYDLRDYSHVTQMLDAVNQFDLFVNCAKPDYAQTQILYRLISSGFHGKILNVGSPVVHCMPEWTDLGLLEYVTQKTALFHAHSVLNKLYPDKLLLWEPMHKIDQDYVANSLQDLGL